MCSECFNTSPLEIGARPVLSCTKGGLSPVSKGKTCGSFPVSSWKGIACQKSHNHNRAYWEVTYTHWWQKNIQHLQHLYIEIAALSSTLKYKEKNTLNCTHNIIVEKLKGIWSGNKCEAAVNKQMQLFPSISGFACGEIKQTLICSFPWKMQWFHC